MKIWNLRECVICLNFNEDGYGDFVVGLDTCEELVIKPEMQPDVLATRFRTTVTEEQLKNLMSNQENSNINKTTLNMPSMFSRNGERQGWKIFSNSTLWILKQWLTGWRWK